jgi:TolB-like protein
MKQNLIVLAAAAILAALIASGCASTPVEKPAPAAKDRPGVVVFAFESKSPESADMGGDVAQAITEALLKGKLLKPVERTELKKILAEQDMSLSGLISDKDAIAVGRIAGARFILLGSLSFVADQVRLNARLLDVETAEIVAAESVYGEKKAIFKLEESLARKIEAASR